MFTPTEVLGYPVGRFNSETHEAVFVFPLLDDPNRPTPFVRGVFTKKSQEKMVFSCNPGSLLRSPILSTLYISSFPNLNFDVEVLVQFSLKPPGRNNIEGTHLPHIKNVKADSGGPLELVESNTDILPPDFIQDLAGSAVLNLYAAIGIPENDFVPSLSFKEFCTLFTNGNFNWKTTRPF